MFLAKAAVGREAELKVVEAVQGKPVKAGIIRLEDGWGSKALEVLVGEQGLAVEGGAVEFERDGDGKAGFKVALEARVAGI